MNKKEMIIVGVIILIFLIVIGTLLISRKNKSENNSNNQQEAIENEFTQNLSDGTKLNTSTKLKEAKMMDNIEVKNAQLTNKNEKSVFLAEVTNKGDDKTEVTLISIMLYDKEGKEIAKIPGIIASLKPGETKQLNTTLQEDYTNAYDYKIVKK